MSCKATLGKKTSTDISFKPVEEVDNVAPISYLLDSLWSSVDIYLNETRVTSDNNFRSISGHLGRMLTFSPEAEKTFLTLEGCMPDRGDPDNTYPLVNSGFGKRRDIWKAVCF